MNVQSFPAPDYFLPLIPESVAIYHPVQTLSFFLSFPKYDQTADGAYGVNHRVVLDACCIVAQNTPGFLSTTSDPAQRVDRQTEALVGAAYHYFVVDSNHNLCNDQNYRLVSCFRDWTFPANIPAHWSHAKVLRARFSTASDGKMSELVKDDDQACIVTGYLENSGACGNAHLVPREEGDWFANNSMNHYNHRYLRSNPQDPANGLCLRRDLHASMDRKAVVFVPAHDQSCFVAYFISDSAVDLPTYFHARRIKLSDRVAPQFLYARFAYNVFDQIPSVLRRLPSPSRSTPSEFPEGDENGVFDSTLLPWVQKLEDLKADWLAKHPNIRQTSADDENPAEGSAKHRSDVPVYSAETTL
ncbi:hypothetical protein BD626DRAFT_522298 [Schizophyllum amplum]|uniref:HNH nuclease domain-containing protein n=1 Tax=Schizophyllum amplum TaxID=97359 RepID=A0A550BTD4_9AGAR|nr:hypothetical protein BD626DRAFT_522298 [Auriculariopsis ampla]